MVVYCGLGQPLIARTFPADWGVAAFATWSLDTSRDHVVQRLSMVSISVETV